MHSSSMILQLVKTAAQGARMTLRHASGSRKSGRAQQAMFFCDGKAARGLAALQDGLGQPVPSVVSDACIWGDSPYSCIVSVSDNDVGQKGMHNFMRRAVPYLRVRMCFLGRQQ